jgi:RecA-family ATPase
VLAESDDLSIEDQKKLFINFKLPIATLVESGGKSVHALVKIDASNEAEYDQRVAFLFDWLAKHKFIVDENNKNPSRLSRLAGVMRKGKLQKLIATDIGCKSWLEWKDYIEGVEDDLPPLVSLADQLENPPTLSPELITGILREGCKMIITGDSKAGKTCLSQNLAVCIAEGRPWLGKFPCQQGKVLYINLEVEEASLYQRFRFMYKAMGIEMTDNGGENIIPWNLRGHAAPMDKLAPKIIRRCRNTGPYKAIILDPLYKVQQGDENSAEAIMRFCNALDKIAHETGAAIIYDHHHPKGDARENVIDRGSGSGVFSRDADAICDISALSPGKELLELISSQMQDGEKPMQIAFVLRDFKDIEPMNIWFRFPLHFVDEAGLLNGAPIKGSREDNLNQSPNRTTPSERKSTLDRLFRACEEDGIASIAEMIAYGEVPETTLRRYLREFDDEYETVKRGFVRRK